MISIVFPLLKEYQRLFIKIADDENLPQYKLTLNEQINALGQAIRTLKQFTVRTSYLVTMACFETLKLYFRYETYLN